MTELGQVGTDDTMVDWLPDGGVLVATNSEFLEFSPTGQRRVVHQAEAFICCGVSPALSPDKRMIASSSIETDPAKEGLWLTDIGTGDTKLLTTTGVVVDIVWSEDGTKIAYQNNEWGQSPLVRGTFVIASTGGDAVQVTHLQGEGESILHWSGAGDRLIVRRRPDGDCKRSCETPQFLSISLDGAEATIGPDKPLLVFDTNGSIGVEGDSLILFPANVLPGQVLDTRNEVEKFRGAQFSPDGNWLSYVRFTCWMCDRPPGR